MNEVREYDDDEEGQRERRREKGEGERLSLEFVEL